jgi:hypothetical protein
MSDGIHIDNEIAFQVHVKPEYLLTGCGDNSQMSP